MRENITFIFLKIQYFFEYKISKNHFFLLRKLINIKGQINPMLKIHLVSYLLIIPCVFISFNLHSQLIADALLGQVSRKCSHLCHFCLPLGPSWPSLSSLNIQFWSLILHLLILKAINGSLAHHFYLFAHPPPVFSSCFMPPLFY
jgi:hypothetical protein